MGETSAERGNPMDLVDKKGISQIERAGLGFLFWGAMRNLFRYILNGYNFSFLILDGLVKSPNLYFWRP